MPYRKWLEMLELGEKKAGEGSGGGDSELTLALRTAVISSLLEMRA